ncbi:helix-turn-helix domain-containing protein [Spongiactinospora sp. TRM90649]|uniref:GlxA family transcriptional regulator n=1 Tax=Spongiactinospora sp. TRM90649 TaxID=3031114 RepID=UPI0023F719E4|nr:helix-turn-helix domain-containing protein [Spongiactinospora sp. TRM90649]MDF5755314.1 helix-turn-helix domain-containing protein [Spongiactinospora sp. TRM90649]
MHPEESDESHDEPYGHDERHRVAVLLLDHVVPFDLGISTHLFHQAKRGGRRLYKVEVCSADGAAVQVSTGYQVLPEHGLEALSRAGTVLIPGIHGGPPLHEGVLPEPVRGALREAAGRARLVSICTGAFVLAAAGLLDGRRAATHWQEAGRFREMFPAVRLDSDVLFVDEGDILTSAGVGAGIDLCLHVVRKDHGSEAANALARRCVVAPWREGGQAQFIERHLPAFGDTGTGPTRAWMLERLHEPLDLAALAAHARMSVRTFTRRFREETGVSPARWLAAQRVERARHLLETTDLPVDEVSRLSGFATAVSLRQHLHAAVGVAPLAYRHTFRASVGAVPDGASVSDSESAAVGGQ